MSSRLALVLALALALRLGLLGLALRSGEPTFSSPDSALYLSLAEGLAEHGSFALDGRPHSFRTPGYPLFLAPGVWLGHVTAWAIAAQLLLALLTVALVPKLLSHNSAGLVGAALYALEPYSAVYSSFLLTEVLFTFLVTLGLALLLVHLRAERPRALYASALALCAATFVRPISYLLAPLLALLLLRRRPREALAYLALSMLPLLAWQARNAWSTGDASFSSGASHTAHYYVALPIRAKLTGQDEEALRRAEGVWTSEREGSVELAIEREQDARELALAHPLVYAEIVARRLAKTLVGNDNRRVAQLVGPALAPAYKALRLALWVVLALSLVGLIFSSELSRAFFAELIVVGFLLGVSALVIDDPRYRAPVMPVLAAWAGAGLVATLKRADPAPRA